MGSSAERKRKRSDEAGDDVAQPSKKVQIADGEAATDGTSAPLKQKKQKESKAGQIRQLKSERRSKKGLASKKNAIRNKEETIQRSNGPDTLASGEDFVSLGEQTAVKSKGPLKPQAASVPPQRLMGKPKKSSPRSMRKAAKAEKITAALAEEGLVAEEGAPESKNLSRFICFVGNLPYTATTGQIEAHFSKLEPKAVRHSTDKDTGKSKGFAFLEFDDYDRMKTCLKNYHQSIFDPNAAEVKLAGGSKKTYGRKLNVELTAGGGGNTQNRKEKIREKNNRLKEERAKRKLEKQKEMQEKLKKRREQREKASEKNKAKGPSGANAEVMPDARGIHPSRLSRIPQDD